MVEAAKRGRRREDKDAKRKRIDAITEYTSRIRKDGPGSADMDALLYDERGCPGDDQSSGITHP
jgi:hypothetical protein